MTQLYRECVDQPGHFEAHNPGRPIWMIVLCKAITFLYDIACRENPPERTAE